MATPQWSDFINIISPQIVYCSKDTIPIRGTINLQNYFGAYIFVRMGRLNNVAPAVGPHVHIRRIAASGAQDVPQPTPLVTFQDTTTAANLTMLLAASANQITPSSATGFSTTQTCCIFGPSSGVPAVPTAVEWQQVSIISSPKIYFDRNIANTSIASGFWITNQALCPPPVWVDGVPGTAEIEVIFDGGAETNNLPIVVQAFAQAMSGVA